MDCVCHVNHLGVPLSNRSLEIFSIEITAIHFHIAFVVQTCLAGFALQRVKKIPLRKQYSATLNGVEKSLSNGSSGSKIHV